MWPVNALIADTRGNLYGTTSAGGDQGTGTVFELQHMPDGSWNDVIVYSFPANDVQSYDPQTLVFDEAGNIFVAALQENGTGSGGVFKLSRVQSGGWSGTEIYTFHSGNDGQSPIGRLAIDSSGNAYGVFDVQGALAVFELSPQPDGTWTKAVIYTFPGQQFAAGGLTTDSSGNLYGATQALAFELSPQVGGTWLYSTIYDFSAHGIGYPMGDLVMDGTGSLYGASVSGGAYHAGSIMQLTPAGPGQEWSATILHNFSHATGIWPNGNLALDRRGNIYGTTQRGGPSGRGCGEIAGCGVVFQLSLRNPGWSYRVIHSFSRDDVDGFLPLGGVTVLDRTLYGTTQQGGDSLQCKNHAFFVGCGVAFGISPQ